MFKSELGQRPSKPSATIDSSKGIHYRVVVKVDDDLRNIVTIVHDVECFSYTPAMTCINNKKELKRRDSSYSSIRFTDGNAHETSIFYRKHGQKWGEIACKDEDISCIQ